MTSPDKELQSSPTPPEETGRKVYKHWGDLTEHLEVLLRQKVFIFLFMLSAAIGALIISFVVSEKYEASASVYYRPVENVMLRFRSTESLGAPMPTPPFKVIVQTFNDTAKSDALLRPIVEEMKLDRKTPPPDGFRGMIWRIKQDVRKVIDDAVSVLKYGRVIQADPVTSEVRRLSNNVRIASKRDSYVFTLTVRYPDSKLAAAIVDALGKSMVSWLRAQDVMRAEERLSGLKEQMEKKELALAKLRAEKQSLLTSNRLVSLGDETSKGVENLYAMELELARIDSLVEEKRKKLVVLEEKVKSRKYTQPEDMKKVLSEKTFESIDLEGLIAKKRSLDTEHSALKGKLQRLPQMQKQLDDIDARIKIASTDAQQVAELYLETSQRVMGQVGEMRMMMSPVVPAAPVQPIRLYYVSATVAASFIAAITLVYLFNYFNIRVFFYSRGPSERNTPSPGIDKGGPGHA